MKICINHGTIITMDGDTIYRDGCVTVENGVITYVGEHIETPMDADKIIDAKGGVVMPGLINAGRHNIPKVPDRHWRTGNQWSQLFCLGIFHAAHLPQ